MSPPIKKRAIAMEADDDSSSCPLFESPEPSGDEEEEEDDGDDYDPTNGGQEHIIGSTFHVPSLPEGSQGETSLLDSPPGLATQPAHPAVPPKSKLRKVSLSPRDSLARQPPTTTSNTSTRIRRTSPRQAKKDATMEVVVHPDGDENVPMQRKDPTPSASKVTMVESSASRSVLSMNATLAGQVTTTTTTTAAPINTAEKISLQTCLFPGSQESMMMMNVQSQTKPSKKDPSKKSSRTPVKSKDKQQVLNAPEASAKTKKQKNTETQTSTKTAETKIGASKMESKASTDSTTNPAAKPAVASKISVPPSTTTATEESSSTTSVKKAKNKKTKKLSFQDQLLRLLFMSCRPYTVKSLAQELKTNESSVNFCLLSLVDKKWVIKKEFALKSGNRSKELYWGNQEAKAKELMDSLNMVPKHEIEQAKAELKRLQSEQVSLARELAIILKEPSNAELNAQIQEREAEIQSLERRLQETRSRVRQGQQGGARGPGNPLGRPGALFGGLHNNNNNNNNNKRKQPPGGKSISTKRLKKQINDMRLHWKLRKEKCMDFVEQLADGMEKKVKDVVKLLELETDEMEGVKIPPKHNDV